MTMPVFRRTSPRSESNIHPPRRTTSAARLGLCTWPATVSEAIRNKMTKTIEDGNFIPREFATENDNSQWSTREFSAGLLLLNPLSRNVFQLKIFGLNVENCR